MINKNEYQLLCQAFDQILVSDKVDNAIIANTWLHVLREHPVFLKNYNHLFQPLTRYKRSNLLLLAFVRFTAVSIFRISQSIINRRWWYASKCINQSDVLFVSHLTNEEFIGEDHDFYFHDIPGKLVAEDISVTVALINHVKLCDEKKLISWKTNPVPRVVLDTTLTFLDELKIKFTQLKAICNLKKIMSELETPEFLRNQACLQMISPETINALRISKQIRLLVSKTNSKYLVITYEGHAWERLVLHEVRKMNPEILCIAYQHAPIIKYQHASLRNLSTSYNPDILLTSGRIAEQQFKDAAGLTDITIKCLGSVKSTNVSLKSKLDANACLVIPEGLVSECLMLFEFSLLCASKMPNYKFIWRLHPLLSFKDLQDHSKVLESLPENICLSDKTLDFDVQRCDSVLYRGSTAVINAINGGLKPIYYSLDNELSIDPIYQHGVGKHIVNCFSEFEKSIIDPLSNEEKLELINFSRALYSPLDYSLFIKLFKEIRCNIH